MSASITKGDVLLQYISAAFLLGERVAESVPSRVIYVETKEGPTPCVVLASNKDHAASFDTEEGRETLKKVYEIIRLEQPPACVRDKVEISRRIHKDTTPYAALRYDQGHGSDFQGGIRRIQKLKDMLSSKDSTPVGEWSLNLERQPKTQRADPFKHRAPLTHAPPIEDPNFEYIRYNGFKFTSRCMLLILLAAAKSGERIVNFGCGSEVVTVVIERSVKETEGRHCDSRVEFRLRRPGRAGTKGLIAGASNIALTTSLDRAKAQELPETFVCDFYGAGPYNGLRDDFEVFDLIERLSSTRTGCTMFNINM
ncbi:hypothetical protein C8R41DRAFT_863408 [Lentinula lateritia]|uniref:Uncharacterized protein n=1 Tax=Lentinula lateritia TaxID=40482 RepID=A0ABQ8VUM0_9AGAR|nr:hypothetical protein C8R41DRAFT_863408 [Lentinula lateritia]